MFCAATSMDAPGPVSGERLSREWSQHPEQRERCLASLVDDGLLVETVSGYALPE